MISFKSQYEHIQSLASTFPESKTVILQVYQDLTLNKLWKNVEVIPVSNLDTCILQSHEPGTGEDDRLLIIPIRHDETLSTEKIAGLFRGLEQAKIHIDKLVTPVLKITLAIVARDSTVLYYHINKGLSPPKEH